MLLYKRNGSYQIVGMDIRADANHERNQQTQSELEQELSLCAHAFLVVFKYLDVVIGESYSAAPQGCDYQ